MKKLEVPKTPDLLEMLVLYLCIYMRLFLAG